MEKRLSGIDTRVLFILFYFLGDGGLEREFCCACGMFIFLFLQECDPFVDIHEKSIIQAAFLSGLVKRSSK